MLQRGGALKTLCQSRMSESQKNKYHVIPREDRTWNSDQGEGIGELFNGNRVSVWDDEKVLEMDGGRIMLRIYLMP